MGYKIEMHVLMSLQISSVFIVMPHSPALILLDWLSDCFLLVIFSLKFTILLISLKDQMFDVRCTSVYVLPRRRSYFNIAFIG